MAEKSHPIGDIEKIKSTLAAAGVVVADSVITERLDKLAGHKIRGAEAIRNTVRTVAKANGVKIKGSGGIALAKDVKIGEINTAGDWVNITVGVDRIWEKKPASVAQSGIVGDETGTARFTIYEKSRITPLDPLKSYYIKNVVTDMYNGQPQVKINRTSVITEIPTKIIPIQKIEEFVGEIIEVQNGSGLIKRCLTCNAVMQQGKCKEHGSNVGMFDLRIKFIMDNGRENRECTVDKDHTAKITGVTLEAAMKLGSEMMDFEAVFRQFKELLENKVYKAAGKRQGRYLVVEELVSEEIKVDREAIMKKLEAI